MNFDYNEEQQLLADSVRRFLAKDYSFEARKKIVDSKDGWSPAVWAQLAEMGLMGLPFSPDYGGFGGGAVDLMGVMEAAGDAMLVEPYLPTLMAGFAVARAGSDAQKKAILTAVVEGKLKLAFAQTEKGARYNLAKVDAQAKKAGRRLGDHRREVRRAGRACGGQVCGLREDGQGFVAVPGRTRIRESESLRHPGRAARG